MPVAIEVGVDLMLLLAFVVAFGLLAVHRGIFTPILTYFADLFDRISIPIPGHRVHVFGPISAALRWVIREVDHALAALVLACEKGAVALFHALASQARWLGREIGELAFTVEQRFLRIAHATPPSEALWLAVRTARKLGGVGAAVARLAHAVAVDLPRSIARGDQLAKEQLRRLARGIDRVSNRLAHALTAGLAAVGVRVGRLGRTVERQGARIGRLDKTIAAAGAAALVGTALARLGLGWLRCGRVSKVGKRACGMDADLLDDLLAGTLVIAGSVSLVQTARDMQSIMSESVDFTRKLISEL